MSSFLISSYFLFVFGFLIHTIILFHSIQLSNQFYFVEKISSNISILPSTFERSVTFMNQCPKSLLMNEAVRISPVSLKIQPHKNDKLHLSVLKHRDISESSHGHLAARSWCLHVSLPCNCLTKRVWDTLRFRITSTSRCHILFRSTSLYGSHSISSLRQAKGHLF